MTRLMVRLFVEKRGGRAAYGVLSGIVGIVLNIALFAMKLAAGLVLGSISVVADAFNNLTDSASSIATVAGFRMSAKPADKEHPFGHGRMEDVVGIIVGISMIFVGVEFVRGSVGDIINPPELHFGWVPLAVLAFGFVVKLWMYLFNRKLSKTIDSSALMAVAIDSRNDAMVSLVTIFSIGFTAVTGHFIDGFAGLIVAFVLIRSGFGSIKVALPGILGKPVDKKTADDIKRIALSIPGIIGVHDLVVHVYGKQNTSATIHAEVPADMGLTEAHALIDEAESLVARELGVILTIHIDPVNTHDERLNALKGAVLTVLAELYPETDAHEFRIVQQLEGAELIFELEIPHDMDKARRGEMLETLAQRVGEIEGGCTIKANIEHGFVSS